MQLLSVYIKLFLFLPFFGGVFYNILKNREKVVSASGDFVFFVYIIYNINKRKSPRNVHEQTKNINY